MRENFSGNVTKSIFVNCNDVVRSNVFLQIKADIWTPITLQPVTAYFAMSSDTTTNQTKVVARIVVS